MGPSIILHCQQEDDQNELETRLLKDDTVVIRAVGALEGSTDAANSVGVEGNHFVHTIVISTCNKESDTGISL